MKTVDQKLAGPETEIQEEDILYVFGDYHNIDKFVKENRLDLKMCIRDRTGGEPAIWNDEAFIDMLHKAGKYICIETNGTRPLPKGIDWVTCSPKEGAPLKIAHMDEVKVVYLGQDLSSYIKLPAKYHFLQPGSCRNTMETVNYILQHPEWQLSLQTHKMCIRDSHKIIY